MDWIDKAACKNISSEIFYPDGIDKAVDAKREASAKIICKQCPVAAECLMHAITNEEKYGVWGSFAPKERTSILSLFSYEYINVDLCRAIVNIEVKHIKAKVLRNEFTY
jgi:WhiB family redox-sensing transcriptional regulator